MKHLNWTLVLMAVVLSVLMAACDSNDDKSTDDDNPSDGDDGKTTDGDDETDTDSGGDGDSDTLVACDGMSDVAVDILERDIELEGETVTKKVNTVLVVNWHQTVKSDAVKLRFSFENDEWYESPTEPGTTGEHEIPVFGVPELTDITIQIVNETDGDETVCETSGTTGKIPDSVPRATILDYDPSLASSNRWMLGTVEKSTELLGMYDGISTVYILDRQGRIVWYYLDQAWSPVTAYPRIARDGSHFYFDRSNYLGSENSNQPSIVRTTLDFRQFEQIDAPSMTDSMDITDDGGFVYNSEEWLMELTATGKEREIWSCTDWVQDAGIDETVVQARIDELIKWGKIDKTDEMDETIIKKIYGGFCYANSVVFNPLDNTILLSFPYINTVVEVSRESGEIVGQWGDVPGSWQFEPASLGLEFEHGANITPDGTLLLSTHAPGYDDFTKPPHYFIEFELDRDNRIATEIWRYGDGLKDWPACKGEAFPVDGGNRLVNYGTAGLIREITADAEVAWDVKWDADFEVPPEIRKVYDDSFTDDDINNMVGHNVLIDDLYALNEGWESK